MGQDTIDPELRKQLAKAEAKEPVEATVTLDAGPGRAYIPSEEVGAKVKEILREVGREVGEAHEDVNVFENLGSFAVRARPAFLKALLKRPEVAAAMANLQSQDLLIRPVRKGPKPKS
jgi:hypothetical protein